MTWGFGPWIPLDRATKRPRWRDWRNRGLVQPPARWELPGLVTGEPSGVDVLDVDPEGLEWLAANRGRLPITRVHETPRGGQHWGFLHAAGVNNSAGKVAPGVDVRGTGGMIAWWPWIGGRVLSDAPLAEWPEWLLAEVQKSPHACNAPVTLVGIGAREQGVAQSGRFLTRTDYRRIEGWLNFLREARYGTLNTSLFWTACRFAEIPIEQEVAAELMIEACRVNGLLSWVGRKRVIATIKSGLKAGHRGVSLDAMAADVAAE